MTSRDHLGSTADSTQRNLKNIRTCDRQKFCRRTPIHLNEQPTIKSSEHELKDGTVILVPVCHSGLYSAVKDQVKGYWCEAFIMILL